VRQHEHAHIRVVAANVLRSKEPVVAPIGRHPYVHDGDVRLPRLDHAQQGVGIATAAGDLEARILEQPGEALAKQRLVVGDHDSHGISR
jgi:hypothetical protein